MSTENMFHWEILSLDQLAELATREVISTLPTPNIAEIAMNVLDADYTKYWNQKNGVAKSTLLLAKLG